MILSGENEFWKNQKRKYLNYFDLFLLIKSGIPRTPDLLFTSQECTWGKNGTLRFWMPLNFCIEYAYTFPIPMSRSFAYYGFYANAARGKRKKLGIDNSNKDNIEIKILDDAPSPKTCVKSWRQLIYKIYEVDPLKCPKCGSNMKIIAFIQDREEIINILKHIKIWPIEYPQPPPENSFLYTNLLSKLVVSKHLN